MIVKLQNKLIDLNHIFSISEIEVSAIPSFGDKRVNFHIECYFIVDFINDKRELCVEKTISKVLIESNDVENYEASKQRVVDREIKNSETYREFEKEYNKLVELWSNQQSKYPTFKF